MGKIGKNIISGNGFLKETLQVLNCKTTITYCFNFLQRQSADINTNFPLLNRFLDPEDLCKSHNYSDL